MGQSAEATVTLTNERGLHLHVASLIARASSAFDSDITFRRDKLTANGKSVMSLTLLAAPSGTKLVVEANGSDAEAAIQAIKQLFNDGFGERGR